jgi:predicted phage terminase large subunit-like protein
MDFILAAVDTAYTLKEENDMSAMSVWGIFSDDAKAYASRYINEEGRPVYIDRHYDEGAPKLMLMNAWQERLELHELVKKIAETCKKSKVDLLIIENKASGYSVSQELKRMYSHEKFGVMLYDPKSQDKMSRLYSVQPIFAENMVYAPNKQWAEMVIKEVGQFPKGKHDDIVDTVSMSIRHLRDMGLLTRAQERMEEIEQSKVYPGGVDAPLYPA